MRKVAVVLVLLVGFVAAGWSALWFYAAHETAEQFDAWLKREDDQGRDWRCPDRAIAGYPFALTIRCTKPTFSARTQDQTIDQTVRAQAAALDAEISVAHPQRLAVALRAPLTYTTSDGAANLTATWSRLTIDLTGLPGPTGIDLDAADLAVDGTFGDDERQGGKTAGLGAHFALDPALASAVDFAITLNGATVAPLDDLLGGQQTVDLDLNGRLLHVDIDNPRTPHRGDRAMAPGGRRDRALGLQRHPRPVARRRLRHAAARRCAPPAGPA